MCVLNELQDRYIVFQRVHSFSIFGSNSVALQHWVSVAGPNISSPLVKENR